MLLKISIIRSRDIFNKDFRTLAGKDDFTGRTLFFTGLSTVYIVVSILLFPLFFMVVVYTWLLGIINCPALSCILQFLN